MKIYRLFQAQVFSFQKFNISDKNAELSLSDYFTKIHYKTAGRETATLAYKPSRLQVPKELQIIQQSFYNDSVTLYILSQQSILYYRKQRWIAVNSPVNVIALDSHIKEVVSYHFR